MNLSHLLRQQARRRPGELALVWGDLQWTWAECDARVDAMATILAEAGVRKGDRILVQSKNCNQLFESMFACFRLGAVWVPTNYRQTSNEVAYLAQASGAVAMICHADFPEHAAAACSAAPAVRFVIAIGEAPFGANYDELIESTRPAGVRPADVNSDDPCWFFYTSGTTGRPKAAVLTHGQMAFVVVNHIADLMPGIGPGQTSLVVAPLSHGAGVHQLVQVARGVTTVLMAQDGLDPKEAWSLVERWRVSNLFTVPTIVKLLTEHPSVHSYDRSSLQYLIYAGAPMFREDQRHALRTLGNVLVQYYGLGEVTGNITVLPAGLHDPEDGPGALAGSCGYERTGMQVSIQDEDGVELPARSFGEICVCGPAVFAGYFDNPEANESAFRRGWFRTGDLGYQDEQGFLFITGRSSDMYISGGSNIYPREIEEKILLHPAVAEVAVFGMPDATWGEVGVAVAVLRPGISCDEHELLGHLRAKVARYKLPKKVVFRNELPKSGYGKIDKRRLRQELSELEGSQWTTST